MLTANDLMHWCDRSIGSWFNEKPLSWQPGRIEFWVSAMSPLQSDLCYPCCNSSTNKPGRYVNPIFCMASAIGKCSPLRINLDATSASAQENPGPRNWESIHCRIFPGGFNLNMYRPLLNIFSNHIRPQWSVIRNYQPLTIVNNKHVNHSWSLLAWLTRLNHY